MGRRRGERRERTKRSVGGGGEEKKLNEEYTWKGKPVGKRG